MTIIKRFKAYLNNAEIDVRERLFMLLAMVSLAGMIVAIVSGLITGENLESLLITGIGFFIFSLLTWIGYKFDKVIIVTYIVAGILIFVFLPLNFFSSGAIHGGAAIWNVFDTMYVTMVLRGRMRIIFLSCEAVVIGVMYYVYAAYPALVSSHTEETAFQDSLASFYIVSIILIIMVGFQAYLYGVENRRAREQKDEINDLNHVQNRFFSSMSHEIRTPINTIIGLNEMILRDATSEDIKNDAENIESASKMLLHLINDILDMSKFQSGEMQLTETKYYSADMISDVVGMIWVRAREKKLKLEVDISPSIPAEMIGDEVRIKQILINVLNNAVKYTNEGTVSLTVNKEDIDDEHVNIIFNVSDTGMGIRKESMPYLFDAFRRVDEEANRRIEGTGLGLSIVKQFVDLMGGKITVNSVYTRGSTFVIQIPQKKSGSALIDKNNLDNRQAASTRKKYKATFIAPKAKVLVVDDTSTNLVVVQRLLRDTKIQITTASSGMEALEKTLETSFNIILMDHRMPNMDGVECFHRIREQVGGLCKNAKVVALTANAGSEEADLYIREGFDGYLVKPVNSRLLEEEMIRLLPDNLVELTDVEDVEAMSSLWRDDHVTKAMVAISTDGVETLPKEMIKNHHISVIPSKIETDRGVFRNSIDINAESLVAYIRKGNTDVRVHPIEVSEFEQFFADQLQDARRLIHVARAGETVESSYKAAKEASKQFDDVIVIDSDHISSGIGLLLLQICKKVENGIHISEILEDMENMKKKIKGSFVVESLDFLYRTGHTSKRFLNLTKTFSLHPVVYQRRGKAQVIHTYFGSKKRVWKKYIKSTLSRRSEIDDELIMVPYVAVDEEERKFIREQIERRMKFNNIYFQEADSSIAANCGPGTFGLMYLKRS